MRAIVCADKNWGIGWQNGLLIHIPSDMRFFREKTTGNVVVMGRKTLESLPGGRPLPDRDNIVFSRDLAKSIPFHRILHLSGYLRHMDLAGAKRTVNKEIRPHLFSFHFHRAIDPTDTESIPLLVLKRT